MIPKESAEAVADVLVEQARAESRQRLNARPRPLLLLYPFRELSEFEPWQRSAIVQASAMLAMQERSVRLLCLAAVLWLFAVIYLFPQTPFGLHPVLSVLVGWLPFVALQRARIHHHVRQRVAELKAATGGPQI